MNSAPTIRANLDRRGFAVLANVLNGRHCDDLLEALAPLTDIAGQRRGGVRNLLQLSPAVRELAASPPIRRIVEAALAPSAFVVRGILFDKTPEANWLVAWHQDKTIAVNQRVDGLDGFGPWSVKQGVTHVQPPVSVLERMVSLRIHLDDCTADSGPLRVLPGSHRLGVGEPPSQENAVACPVPRGGVLAMRPLLWHSSGKAAQPGHRRVVHLEFADCELPPPLQWRAT